MVRSILIKISTLFILLIFQNVQAEGTKQLRPTDSTNYGSVQILARVKSGKDFAIYNGPADYRLNVTVCQANEVVCLGFQRRSNTKFRVFDPNGNLVVNETSIDFPYVYNTPGLINSYKQAVVGPNLVDPTGYVPIKFTATVTGDYYIEFFRPEANRSDFQDLDYIDITVLRNNVVQLGRLWSKSWLVNTKDNATRHPFEGQMYIYSNDQIVTKLDFNGIMPFEFNISCNSTGTGKSGLTDEDQKSVYGYSSYPEYKIFLNNPDIACFPDGSYGQINGNPSVSGCGTNSCINVDVTKPGTITVLLDLDGVSGFQDGGKDLKLTKKVAAPGVQCVPWDGKDGLGNVVANKSALNVTADFINGITHLPLYDAEDHPNGFIVTLVRPAPPSGVVNPPIFWDDSKIGYGASVDGSQSLTTGCTSATGCHKWTGRGSNTIMGGATTQSETINTWWYAAKDSKSTGYTYTLLTVDANKNKAGKGASNNDTHCGDGTAYQLQASSSGTTSIKWTTSGTGTFTSDTDSSGKYTPSTADITAGSVKLKVVTTAGGVCPADADSIILSFVKPITLNQGADSAICQNNAAIKLYATASDYNTVTWSGGTGSFTSTGSLTPTYTPSAAELNQNSIALTITATPSSAKCQNVSKVINLTVLKTPVVDAGTNKVICSNNSLIALAGTSSTGSALWSGGSNFGAPLTTLSNTYQPSSAEINTGNLKLYLTSTANRVCTPVVDSVVYTLTKNIPSVSLGVDKQVCKNNTSISLTATVNNASGVRWSNFSGTMTANDSASTVTYKLSNAEVNAGFATLIAKSRGNGTCNAVSDTIKLSVINAPVVNAGANFEACSNNLNITINGTVTGASGAQWTGLGTFKQGNNSLSNIYVPTQNEVDFDGSSILFLTSTGNGTCAPVSDTIEIFFVAPPSVDAGLNTSLCANDKDLALRDANSSEPNGIVWTSSGSGLFSPSANILNPIYRASDDDTLLSNIVLKMSVTQAIPPCMAVMDSIIVTVVKSPKVSAGLDLQICKNNPMTTLLATSTTGAGNWSLSAAADGTLKADAVNKLLATFTASTQAVNNGTPLKVKFTSSNNGLCKPVADSMVITFINAPKVNAGTDTNVCANNSLSKLKATSSTGSVLWSNYAGTITPNNTTASIIYQPSAAEIASGEARLIATSQDNGLCSPVQDTVAILIGPKPIVDAGTDIDVCADVPLSTLVGKVTNAGGGVWSVGAGTFGNITTNLNNTYTPSVGEIQAGVAHLVLTSSNNGLCNPESDTLQINVAKAPSVDAGNDQTICVNSATVDLSGVFNNAGGIEWSTSGTGTFDDKNKVNAQYTPSAKDKTDVLVTLTIKTIQNGLCKEVKDDMRVLFTSAPSLDAGKDQVVCTNDFPVQLSAIGSPSEWKGGTGTFIPDRKSLTATYQPSAAEITAGTVKLTLETLNSDECPKLVDDVIVTIKPAPVADAGADQNICGNDNTLTLTSVNPNVRWATTNGTGNFVNPNLQNAVYQISEQDKLTGKVTFVLTTTNNLECSATRDTVNFAIRQPIVVDAGPDKNVCANNAQIFLNGTLLNATDGNWTGGTGSFFDATSLNTTYTPSSGDISAGFVELTLTSAAVASCPSFNDKVRFTITPSPTINAGADQTVCADVDSVVLNAVINGVAQGVEWSSTGTGVFSPSFAQAAPQYYFSDADLKLSTITLFAKTVASGNCNEVTDFLKVTINPKPILSLGKDTAICSDKSTLGLVANVQNATGVNWSSLGKGTLASPSGLTNTYNIVAGDKTGGLFTILATTTGNGLCRPVSDELVVEIKPAPTVTVGQDMVTCANVDTISIGASFTIATGGVWASSGSGTFINGTNPFSKYVLSSADKSAGFVNLRFTTTGNGDYNCNAVSDTLLLTINAQPVAHAGNDITICADSSGVNLAGTTTNATGLIWSSDGTGSFFPNTIAPNANFVPSQTDRTNGSVRIFLNTTGNGACNAAKDTLVLTILPRPIVDAGVDQTICSSEKTVTLTGTVQNAGGGVWFTSGTGTFSPNDSSLTTTYTISQTDINVGKVVFNLNATKRGLCRAVFDQVQVKIDALPIVIAGEDRLLCADTKSIPLSGSIQNAKGGVWTVNGDGVFTKGVSALSNVYDVDKGDVTKKLNFILTSQANGACKPIADTLSVVFNPAPTVNATDNFSICKDATGFNLSSTHTNATGIKWSTDGVGVLSPNNLSENINYALVSADTLKSELKFNIETTGSGVCKPAKDSLIVGLTPIVTFSAGPDVTICADQQVIFVLSQLTVATKVQWVSSGNGFFLPDDQAEAPIYIATPEDSIVGSVQIQGLTLDNGTCKAKSDAMNVFFDPVPEVSAGTDLTVCIGADSVRLDGYVKNTTGVSWSTSGSGTFDPNSESLSTYYRPSSNDYIQGSLFLTLTPKDVGSCNPIASTIELKFSPAPGVSAGADKAVCNTDLPIILEGSGANSRWIGAGTFTPSEFVLNAQYVPTAGEVAAHKVTLILETVKDKNCAQTRDTVDFALPDGPRIDAGPDLQFMCANSDGLLLTAATNNGVSPQVKWTTASGRGTFLPNATTLNATFVPAQSQIDNGRATLILETTNNGICKTARDQVNLTITPAPSVNVGQDLTICADLDTLVLSSIFKEAGNLEWHTSGDGTFDDIFAASPKYKVGTNDKATKTVSIRAITKNVGLCKEVSDTIGVTITPAPTLNAITDFTLCNSTHTFDLNVTSTVALGVEWSTARPGIISPNITEDSIKYQLDESDRALSALKFYVTTTGVGTCKPLVDSVTVSVDHLQSVTAQDDTLICSTKKPIPITSVASTAVLWSGGSNQFGNPTAQNTTYTMNDSDISNGSALLTVATTINGVCPKAEDFALIQIIPSPEVVVNAGMDQELCKDNIETRLQGFVLNAGGGEWTILTGNGSFSDRLALAPTYKFGTGDTAATSVKLLLTSVDNGLCFAVTDTMEVKFSPLPKVSAGLDQSVCEDTAYVAIGTSYTVAKDHVWTSNGDGVFSPNPKALNAKYMPGPKDIQNKKVDVTVTTQNNGTCIGTYKDEMKVTLLAKPVISAGLDKYACPNIANVPVVGSITRPNGIQWTSSGTGIIKSSNTATPIYSPSTNDKLATQVQLTATSTGNSVCKTVTDKMFIFFNKNPQIFAGPDVQYCQSVDEIQLLGRVDNNSQVFWSTQETGTFNPNSVTAATSYTLSPEDKLKPELEFTLIARTIAGCSPVSDKVVFTLQALPVVDPGSVLSCAYRDGIQLNGSVQNALGGKWTSVLGSGTFAPSEDSLKGKYFLAQADFDQPEIDLTLTSVGNGVCPADSKTTKLNLNPLPVALAGGDQYVCTGARAGLSARVFRDIKTYEWKDLSNNSLVGSTPVVFIPSVTTAKSYQLKLINKFGCEDLDTVKVTNVNPVNFGMLPHYCLENELEISSGVASPSPLVIYQWYKDNVMLQDKIDPTLIVRAAGTYQVDYSVDRCTYTANTEVTEPPFLYHNDRIACSASSLDIATALLPNVAYTWKSGVGNKNVSKINVLADTNRYYVSAKDTKNCVSDDSIRVIGIDRPAVKVADTAICNKDTVALKYRVINSAALTAYKPQQFWTIAPAKDSLFRDPFLVSETGNYILHVYVDACMGTDTGSVSINTLPSPVPLSEVEFCNYDGKTLNIDAGAGTGLSYSWNVPGTTRIITVDEPGLYVVTKTDKNKCAFTDTITVTERCGPRFFLPEAFTPTSKNANDKMYVFGRNFTKLKLTVYNRWGEIIYYTEDRNKPWDGFYQGKQVETGIYPYTVSYEGLHDEDRGPYEKRGSVFVIGIAE